MIYCTYPEYQAAGGAVSEAAFGVLCKRASRLIDRITMGRAERHCAACESCRASLADACGQIVDLLAAQSAVGALPGATSVSNDGYTVSFSGSITAQMEGEVYALLASALGADPHGLMYRGCF